MNRISKYLNKLILEQRKINVDDIDFMSRGLDIEEIEKNKKYLIKNYNLIIEYSEIEYNMIYDFGIQYDNENMPRLGTVYNINENLWIAKSEKEEYIQSEGKTLIDVTIGFLSINGFI